MAEKAHVEEAAQAHFGVPKPTVNRPARARQVRRLPAPPHFHDANTIALLRQPQRGNAATEAGPDDNEVEIEFTAVRRHSTTPRLSKTF